MHTPNETILCAPDAPVADTRQGRLRGFTRNGVTQFRGIRYARAERFCLPQPPLPWQGIRNALQYGYVCPNPAFHTDPSFSADSAEMPMDTFTLPQRFWPENEHCQFLNIWAPANAANTRRPVMVWLHGGGYTGGSSLELAAYDGEALARVGDVIVVTLNHRLNLLGYLDLSAYGEKYRHSANVGMWDIIAALRWIRENIAAFGGDPDNVTLFGQSGGGGKVATLLQMPAADGLYHKAIIQSGALSLDALRRTPASARADTEQLLARLELNADTISRLETLPFDTLAHASNAIAREQTGAPIFMGWAPVPGEDFVGDPLLVGFRQQTAHIPIIVGSNLCEFSTPAPGSAALSPEKTLEVLRPRAKGRAAELAACFAAVWPQLPAVYAAAADSTMRSGVTQFCTARAAMTNAPVYQYLFAFESPVLGGFLMGHSSEIAFVFHNAACGITTAAGESSGRLEEEMSLAWAHFARTGSPDGAGLPDWPAFNDPQQPSCLVYENGQTAARPADFDAPLQQLLAQLDASHGPQ